MRQEYVEKYFRNGYRRFMKRNINRKDSSIQQIIDERLKIISFYDRYGATAGFPIPTGSVSTAEPVIWSAGNGRNQKRRNGEKASIHKHQEILFKWMQFPCLPAA